MEHLSQANLRKNKNIQQSTLEKSFEATTRPPQAFSGSTERPIVGVTAGGDNLQSQSDKAIELASDWGMLVDAIDEESTLDNSQIK